MYKQRILTGVTSLLVIGTLGLTGCSTGASTSNGASASSNSSSYTMQSNNQHRNEIRATVTLKSPSGDKSDGMASMTLNTKSHELTVVLEVSGLKPGGKYGVDIYNTVSHKTVYNLKPFTGDKQGDGLDTTVIKNVKEIPSTSTASQLGVYRAGSANTSPLVYGDIKQAGK
jgi:hypothetical protein